MAVNPNTITTADVCKALDKEFIENFKGEYDRLEEILGLFPVETVAAGTALYQYVVTGELVDGATGVGTTYAKTTDTDIVAGKTYYTLSDGAYSPVAQPAKAQLANYYEATTNVGASSGTAYIEGDTIARSKYQVTRTPVGDMEFVPYAKQTTAQAILKGGFENAVMRTDKKAMQQLRAAVIAQFFAFLATGTGAPSATTVGLQATLAHVAAKLSDTLETAGDNGGSVVYFVNTFDAAAYLADAAISTQELFGLKYVKDFLGVENVIVTNKVTQGTVIATPVENIHVYGLDFSALGDAGLVYESDALGLVGVHHVPDYDRASAETYLVKGMTLVPEKLNYIVKGTISSS